MAATIKENSEGLLGARARIGIACVVFLVLAACPVTFAYTPGEFTSRVGSADRERAYNIRWGDLQLDLGARFKVGFDDNVGHASGSGSKEKVTTLEYGLDVGVYYPASFDLRLDGAIYIGRRTMFGDIRDDTGDFVASTNEGAAFAADMRVGDNGILSIVDSIWLHQDRLELVPDQESGALHELENDFGLQYEHQLSKVQRVATRLGRYDIMSLSSDIQDRDRITYYIAFRADRQMSRKDQLWPMFRAAWHLHPKDQHNDGVEYEAVLGWTRQQSTRTRLSLSGGVQWLLFSTDNVPEATEERKAKPVAKLVYMSQLTRRINHGLTLKYYGRIGAAATVNYHEDFRASYRVTWAATRRWQFTYMAHLMRTKYSGASGLRETYLIQELQLEYRYNRISTHFGYSRTDKFSNGDDRDYARNEFVWGMKYNF